MIRVEISGPVSSGKTPGAQALKMQYEKMDKKVFISDHRLYSFNNSFHEDLERDCEYAKSEGYDVCILVIGANRDNHPPNSLVNNLLL